MDWNSVKLDLTEELGREPTYTEIELELSSRIQCVEAMCDDIDTRRELEDAQLTWNGDY